MAAQNSGRSSRRGGRGRSRRGNGEGRSYQARPQVAKSAPKKQSLWEKIASFFGNGNGAGKTEAVAQRNGTAAAAEREPNRPARKPQAIEVTTPRLYVGNLSFNATESDLFELFNGVGQVQNAEIVSYKHNQRSKGFAFVQMLTVEEAKRAVSELHDREFLGRKLVVSGAKASEHASS